MRAIDLSAAVIGGDTHGGASIRWPFVAVLEGVPTLGVPVIMSNSHYAVAPHYSLLCNKKGGMGGHSAVTPRPNGSVRTATEPS